MWRRSGHGRRHRRCVATLLCLKFRQAMFAGIEVDQRFGQGKSTLAGWVHQPFVGSTILQQHFGGHLEQVACHEAGGGQRLGAIAAGLVCTEVLPRARHQRLAAFDAQHLASLGSQRQGEVAQAAEPVDDALVRLHVQQAQRTRHQHPVDVRVHLGEVGGLEGHSDAEIRQGIGQLLAARLVQQMRGLRALGLQPPLDGLCGRIRVVPGSKGPQLLEVGLAQRLQVPQHQGRDPVPGGQFDLRAGFTRLQGFDQGAQRQQHVAHVRRQHPAHRHVGHIAALALVEADQHLALFLHITHRQAGTVAVAPGGALDGPQHHAGLDLAQVPEVVFQHPLLGSHLGAGMQMLHLAAAAGTTMQAEVRAVGAHALGRFPVDRRDSGLFPVVLFAIGLGTDVFEGQRTFDEHHLAVTFVRNTLRIQIK